MFAWWRSERRILEQDEIVHDIPVRVQSYRYAVTIVRSNTLFQFIVVTVVKLTYDNVSDKHLQLVKFMLIILIRYKVNDDIHIHDDISRQLKNYFCKLYIERAKALQSSIALFL